MKIEKRFSIKKKDQGKIGKERKKERKKTETEMKNNKQKKIRKKEIEE